MGKNEQDVHMSKGELIKRYLIFFFSVIINGGGIAAITAADIGTTPISSPNYVISLHTPLTLGMVTLIFNLMLIGLQLIVLGRKNIKKYAAELLFQIPVCCVFAPSIDIWMLLLAPDAGTSYSYGLSWLLVVIGTIVLALGISLEFTVNVAMVPGEYFLKVFHRVVNRSFGFMKTFFDIFLVLCAVVFSLIFTGLAEVEGVREGTLFAALVTGPLVRYLIPKLAPINYALSKGRTEQGQNG